MLGRYEGEEVMMVDRGEGGWVMRGMQCRCCAVMEV